MVCINKYTKSIYSLSLNCNIQNRKKAIFEKLYCPLIDNKINSININYNLKKKNRKELVSVGLKSVTIQMLLALTKKDECFIIGLNYSLGTLD
jgi:hypothetical protein